MAVDDVDIKALDSNWEKEVHIPAYGSANFAQAFAAKATQAAGTNGIRVVEANKVGVYLARATQGATYTVQLSNFKPDTGLTVQLLGSQEVDGVPRQTVAFVGSVTTDGFGQASLTWSVDVPAGLYYIKSMDATGAIFGMSVGIDVVGV